MSNILDEVKSKINLDIEIDNQTFTAILFDMCRYYDKYVINRTYDSLENYRFLAIIIEDEIFDKNENDV